MDPAPFVAFIALTFVASITPGPAVLLVMAHGLKGGWVPSLKASLGVQAGNGIYLTLSAIGRSRAPSSRPRWRSSPIPSRCSSSAR